MTGIIRLDQNEPALGSAQSNATPLALRTLISFSVVAA